MEIPVQASVDRRPQIKRNRPSFGAVSLLGVDLDHSVGGEEAEDTSHSPQFVNHNDLASVGRGKHSTLGIGIGNLENQVLGISQRAVFLCVHLVNIEVANCNSVSNSHRYHFLSFFVP